MSSSRRGIRRASRRYDGAHVARQDECVNLEVGVSHQHVERAGHVLMRGIDAEVFKTSMAAARLMAMATSGVVVSKPTPTNTTGRLGFSLAMVSASSGEYANAAASRPSACSFEQGRRASGDTRHVAEGGQNHVRNARERNDGVDIVVAGDANGASRSAREAAAFRHEVASAVACNGHGGRHTPP